MPLEVCSVPLLCPLDCWAPVLVVKNSATTRASQPITQLLTRVLMGFTPPFRLELVSFISVAPHRLKLSEEKLVDVRAVNLRMTDGARLELRRLVVEGRRARRICERCCMALQAQQIHVAHLQQVGIRRSVGNVARYAAFHLDRLVLKHKRSLLIGVAF